MVFSLLDQFRRYTPPTQEEDSQQQPQQGYGNSLPVGAPSYGMAFPGAQQGIDTHDRNKQSAYQLMNQHLSQYPTYQPHQYATPSLQENTNRLDNAVNNANQVTNAYHYGVPAGQELIQQQQSPGASPTVAPETLRDTPTANNSPAGNYDHNINPWKTFY